jgi:titin
VGNVQPVPAASASDADLTGAAPRWTHSWWSIQPTDRLPNITNDVIINGWTQPGFVGSPLIELNGSHAGAGPGLEIDSTNDTMSGTICGLVVNGFDGDGVLLYNRYTNSGNDVVEGCYIGTDVSGTARMPNVTGITVCTTSNRIGTNGDGVNDTAEGNLISGNERAGLLLVGSGATGNVIAGNRIGTDVTGTQAVANGGSGVALLGASNNTIGTSGHDSDDAGERNLISGNSLGFSEGILIDSGCSNNVIAGNYIGTDVTGMLSLPNSAGGVNIYGDHNRVGTTADGTANPLEANVILQGVGLLGAEAVDNVVAGNVAVSVTISGASGNTVGGTAAARNVLGGVFIRGSGTSGNVVEGNYIGTDATGTVALGNSYGVAISSGATNNTIGGTTAAARNIISGNVIAQILIGGFHDEGTSGNVVEGNYIGTDVSGSNVLGGGMGVLIFDSSNNSIGGIGAGAGNLIAGNSSGGVIFFQTLPNATFGNSVLGNSIHDNGGLGIGVNINQAAPVLPAAVRHAGGQAGGAGAGHRPVGLRHQLDAGRRHLRDRLRLHGCGGRRGRGRHRQRRLRRRGGGPGERGDHDPPGHPAGRRRARDARHDGRGVRPLLGGPGDAGPGRRPVRPPQRHRRPLTAAGPPRPAGPLRAAGRNDEMA